MLRKTNRHARGIWLRYGRAAVLALGAIAVAGLAASFGDDHSPSRVDRFLAYCDRHESACEKVIADVNLAMELEYMPGTQYCAPRRVDWKIEEQSVSAWLSTHPKWNHRKTNDGVRAALFTVNHCASEGTD